MRGSIDVDNTDLSKFRKNLIKSNKMYKYVEIALKRFGKNEKNLKNYINTIENIQASQRNWIKETCDLIMKNQDNTDYSNFENLGGKSTKKPINESTGFKYFNY